MTSPEALLLGHAFATVAMAGLIWFVQVVHYPLMARVSEGRFVAYEAEHVRRTTWVVAPLMLSETALAGWLFVKPPANAAEWMPSAGIALLAVCWASTALLQVPCHRTLESGYDRLVIQRLVRSNWIRTFAWTGRAVLALLMLAGAVQ